MSKPSRPRLTVTIRATDVRNTYGSLRVLELVVRESMPAVYRDPNTGTTLRGYRAPYGNPHSTVRLTWSADLMTPFKFYGGGVTDAHLPRSAANGKVTHSLIARVVVWGADCELNPVLFLTRLLTRGAKVVEHLSSAHQWPVDLIEVPMPWDVFGLTPLPR